MSPNVPQDLDAERQVLGALLVRPELLIQVSTLLHDDDFYLSSHRTLYHAITELTKGGNLTIDPLQVIHYLQDRSIVDEAGGASMILALAQDVLAPASAPAHARRIHVLSVRRRLQDLGREIQSEAGNPQEDENDFLKSVEERLLKITNQATLLGPTRINDFQEEFRGYLTSLIENKGQTQGLQTRFEEFDRLTGGLRGGELLILAARPGMGKTTLAMNMVSNVAFWSKQHVLVFSLEMSMIELVMRMLCAESQINHGELKRGRVSKEQVPTLLSSMNTIFNAPISIDDSGTLDIWDCVARTRKLAVDLKTRGEKLGLVVVDYLQLMGDSQSRKFGRQNEVASVSRNLKQLAKAVDAPVLALSQMNRSVEQRRGDSARPQLSDLRESGAIEQDADIVMFIHRDPNAENDPERPELRGTAEIIVAKYRNGAPGNFHLAFRPEVNRFDNLQLDDGGY